MQQHNRALIISLFAMLTFGFNSTRRLTETACSVKSANMLVYRYDIVRVIIFVRRVWSQTLKLSQRNLLLWCDSGGTVDSKTSSDLIPSPFCDDPLGGNAEQHVTSKVLAANG